MEAAEDVIDVVVVAVTGGTLIFVVKGAIVEFPELLGIPLTVGLKLYKLMNVAPPQISLALPGHTTLQLVFAVPDGGFEGSEAEPQMQLAPVTAINWVPAQAEAQFSTVFRPPSGGLFWFKNAPCV